MMWGYGYYGPYSWADAIGHLIWFILVIWLVVWVLRMLVGGGRRRHWRRGWGSSAIDILEERYAKGEIDKIEYDQKKKDLES